MLALLSAVLAQKDYIRDNIRRLRSITVANGQRPKALRGAHLPTTRMGVFERYLADISANQAHPPIDPDSLDNQEIPQVNAVFICPLF